MPFTFHPYLMQIASVNSCLFSAYPVALIGKTDSQEDAFSIAPFMSFCDSGVISAKSSSQMFFHFSLVVFCFFVSGELLVRGVVVKIELLSVDFGCQFVSDLRGVLIFCFGSFPRICQT